MAVRFIIGMMTADVVLGLSLIGWAIYLRITMSDDAFDPNRLLSVSLLFAAMFCFFTFATLARIGSLFDDGEHK